MDWARYCYTHYPTIENNIPKDTRSYDRTMDDYAAIDNKLAASQLDIGESSNLAQVAQTYDCTFGEQLHKDAVCILSILAQVSIDSAKRVFDVDVGKEIRRLKKEMRVDEIKYPQFWQIIRKDFNRKNINPLLHCPMDYLYGLQLDQFRADTPTLSMDYFFIKHPIEHDRRTCRKVEELIDKYSSLLYDYYISIHPKQNAKDFETNNERYLLLQADLEGLINDIQKQYVSSNYAGLFSWLIDRALIITPQMISNNSNLKNTVKKNRSLLFKTLYGVNKRQFLMCFKRNPQ